jgi:hypothetical protein
VTLPSQKNRERFFIEEAAKLLGKTWSLGPDRERPDFTVTEGTQQFGIEVCGIFTGPQNRAGSKMKEAEAKTQQAVNALRHEYETKQNIPLSLKFVGDMCAENMATVVPALVAEDLASKPVGHHVVIDADKGSARLRVHVTRALQSDWFSVNDRVGWLDCYPIDRIVEEIEKKSKKLPRYREYAGLDDIRLLIVANRIMNSGKLSLQELPALDTLGFQVVYFFSYPECVTVLGCASDSARVPDICANEDT